MRTSDPREVAVCLSLVVWGEEHVLMFLELCLPSLLAPGNIPSLSHRAGSKFLLHTREADMAVMARSPAFQRLMAHIEVDARSIDTGAGDTHEVLSHCHSEAVEIANAAAAPVIFLAPDVIWADGSLAAVDRLLSSGKRVIFMPPCRRMVKEEAEPAMRQLMAGLDTVALSL